MPSIALPVSLRGQLLSGVRSAVAAFSPIDLFATGSQGIWLDPSDLTTMFSDRAGTTPVTTPGTVVGLRLDKSKGLVLGSELVTNGTFVADSNWTKDAGWAISGGVAVATAAAVSSELSQAITVVEGSWYQIEVTATITSGSICARLYQTGEYVQSPVLASGSNRFTLQSGASGSGSAFTNTIALAPLGAFTGTIDNISVRELAGNHAVAPTDAARPIYGVEPKGGRRNLLTYSEDFDNAAWSKTNATIAPNTAAAPDGTMTAEKIIATNASGNHFAGQTVTMGAAAHTISVYMKAAEYTTGSIFITQSGNNGAVFTLSGSGSSVASGTGNTASIVSVGNDWYRCSVTNNGSADIFDAIRIGPADGATAIYTGDNTSGILIWGAQLETGSTATAYQRVTTAYDITESGVATCHYVQYDGSDDSLSTSAIDFTATDKMSVFAGVRKLSDSAGTIFESSIASGSNNGTILLSNFYSWRSRGTENGDVNSSLAAPTSNVLTGLGDISGDRSTLRINGAQVAQSTTDQGTGNYGNYPLFIGRRNNATLPFNGRDFGIIIVGKAASAGEITDTETWLAARTAQVTL